MAELHVADGGSLVADEPHAAPCSLRVDESLASNGSAVCSSGLDLFERRKSNDVQCVLGMSLENGYFTAHRVQALVSWAASEFPTGVIIMLPDRPAEHTYRAFGFDSEKSQAKAKRHGRNLLNKILRAIDSLPDDYRFRVRVIDWRTEVETNESFTATLQRVRSLYESDVRGFRCDVNSATAQVVGRVSNPIPIDCRVGAECLLQEMAFLESIPPIMSCISSGPPKESAYIFVYHKPWPVFCAYVEKHARGVSSDRMGFLCVCDSSLLSVQSSHHGESAQEDSAKPEDMKLASNPPDPE